MNEDRLSKTFEAMASNSLGMHVSPKGRDANLTANDASALLPSQLALVQQCKQEMAMNFSVPARMTIEAYARQVGVSVAQMEKLIGL